MFPAWLPISRWGSVRFPLSVEGGGLQPVRSVRLLLCLLALSATVQAQRYVYRNYRQAEGLKNLAVHTLTKDSHGFLWAATENSIYRFLGSSFERFEPEQGVAESDVRERRNGNAAKGNVIAQ